MKSRFSLTILVLLVVFFCVQVFTLGWTAVEMSREKALAEPIVTSVNFLALNEAR